MGFLLFYTLLSLRSRCSSLLSILKSFVSNLVISSKKVFFILDPLPFKNLKTTPKFRFQFNLQNPDDSSKDQH